MKSLIGLAVLAASLSSLADSPKSIYGADNRKDLYEVTNPSYLKLAQSTAARIEHDELSQTENPDITEILGLNIRFTQIACEELKFSTQVAAASCSGFLVAKDVIATAGHCIKNAEDCSKYRWVFGYGFDKPEPENKFNNKYMAKIDVMTKDIYSCASIITTKLDSSKKLDYALVKLDRPVLDREPLKFRTAGKLKKKISLVVIGHPSGLPTKVADDAKVEEVDKTVFFSSLDTFGGNSGSAVINTETEEVEGILVAGRKDYIYNSVRKCQELVVCKEKYCEGGEKATRITVIPELQGL